VTTGFYARTAHNDKIRGDRRRLATEESRYDGGHDQRREPVRDALAAVFRRCSSPRRFDHVG